MLQEYCVVKLGAGIKSCPGVSLGEDEIQMYSIITLTEFVFMFGHGPRPPGPLQKNNKNMSH